MFGESSDVTCVTFGICWQSDKLNRTLIHLLMLGIRLQDNSPTNQLAVSQVADWITRGLVNSPTANFLKSWNYYTLFVQ